MDDVPAEVPMREYVAAALRKTCAGLMTFYVENGATQKAAFDNTNRIYEAVLEPWKSLPATEEAPRDVLYVAKNVANRYYNREVAKHAGLLHDCVKYAEAAKAVSGSARRVYDDIISLWSGRPSGSMMLASGGAAG